MRDGNRDGNRGNNGGRQDEMMHEVEPFDADDSEIISPAELTQSRSQMNLTELKAKPIHELVKVAETMGLESMARSRKQDIIFSILKAHARNGENIYGDGVLEILQDGFGFLRSSDGSYLAGPDDIYVSPSQIRRFNLRTGDTISGLIRPPKDGERYFALLKVGEINFDSPDRFVLRRSGSGTSHCSRSSRSTAASRRPRKRASASTTCARAIRTAASGSRAATVTSACA